MARKTFDVEALRVDINHMLRVGINEPEYRKGLMAVLETVLHETGNYQGFRYLSKRELAQGIKPGTNSDADVDDYDARFKDTDSTRVHYF